MDIFKLVDHVQNCINLAERGESKLPREVWDTEKLFGMSSPKNRHFLNNLLDRTLAAPYGVERFRYLEIGCWKGSTAIAALYKNPGVAYWVVDDFSTVWNPRLRFEGDTIKTELFDNFNTYLGHPPNLIEQDVFSINPAEYNISNVNFYFYDGSHTELDQYNGIMYFFDQLADDFVIIVDDYMEHQVREGTHRAVLELLKTNRMIVYYEAALGSLNNGNLNHWWNGLYVMVGHKNN